MSVKMTALVWDHFPRNRSDLVLALAIADHANHEGGDIFPAVAQLAWKTRQTERNCQRQLRALELAGWLECVERSSGGRNRASRYRIAPAWIEAPAAFAFGARNPDKMSPFSAPKPRQNVTVYKKDTVTFEAQNGDTAMSPAKNRQEPSVFSLEFSKSDSSNADEDSRLAKWMFGKIQLLNPNQRPPPWRRWRRDIRLMRERDDRTRHQIAELFAWANEDEFWRSNILSPGKLREKWDQLTIRRLAAAKATAPPAAVDRRCVGEPGGTRCTRMGRRSAGLHAGAPWYCDSCWDDLERRRAT